MKKIVVIAFVGIIFSSCNQKNGSKVDLKKSESGDNNIETQNMDWLIGKWERSNEEKGKETFENWKKISDSEYVGIGFTMQNADTIQQEKLKIIKSAGKWNLIVKIPQEKGSVIFNITEFDVVKFVCTNDSIDFPKRIEYWKSGDNINALLSGGEQKILFQFKRLK